MIAQILRGPEPYPEPPYPPAPDLRACGHSAQHGAFLSEAQMVAWLCNAFRLAPTRCVACATRAALARGGC